MTTHTDINQPEGTLSIGNAISKAFSPLFTNLKIAFKFTILPSISITILVIIGIYYVSTLFVNGTPNIPDFTLGFVLSFIAIFLFTGLISIQFYTAWIRFLHNGETSFFSTFTFNLKKRHFVVYGKGFLLGTFLYLVMIAVTLVATFFTYFAPAFLSVIITIAVILLISIISLRLSYVFPAAALDQPYSFLTSWKHTKDQWVRLVVSFILLSIIFTVITIVINMAIGLVFSVVGSVFSLFSYDPDKLATSQDILKVITSPSFLVTVIPIYFVTLIITMMSYIPFINMHYYCFQANTRLMDDQQLVERFS